MRCFSAKEATELVKAASEGRDSDVDRIITSFHSGCANARILLYTDYDAVMTEAVTEAAKNGHVSVLKVLHGYTGVAKHLFPELILRKRWEVLDWLTNKEGAPGFMRFRCGQIPFNAFHVAMTLQEQSVDEREGTLSTLKKYFPEDFSAEFIAEVASFLDD